MAVTLWSAWSADWELRSKVEFDGINKIIYVHPEVTNLDIRADVYSEWIKWVSLRDNLKFLPAIRYTGFDPIGGGNYTGDTYFLLNGWKLSIDLAKVRVTGVLYSDDYPTAYYTPALVAQYPATVSSLVNTSVTYQNVVTGTASTPAEIAAQVRAEIAIELARLDSNVSAVPTNVWTHSITALTDKTTIGGYITKLLLTIPKFIGLK
jgi:hypothetical protein